MRYQHSFFSLSLEINFSITRPKCNSFSETTQGVDGTDSAAPTVTSSPASHGDTHHSPAVAVSSAHSTPVAHHHPGLTATSPQLDTSISPLQQSLLSDKLVIFTIGLEFLLEKNFTHHWLVGKSFVLFTVHTHP